MAPEQVAVVRIHLCSGFMAGMLELHSCNMLLSQADAASGPTW